MKLKIPTRANGRHFGQVAFGTEFYKKDGRENVFQRFAGAAYKDKCLCVYNNGIYSGSMRGQNLYLTLLNGAAYCAHPIGNRPLFDKTRFIPFIEQGKHEELLSRGGFYADLYNSQFDPT